MRNDYRTLGGAFVGLLVLAVLISWLTGSGIVWWGFLGIVVVFAVLTLTGVLRPRS